ncbi:DUF4465 domain-containing protein [Flavobacteriaceae bacterium F08102]|nr:DUF4465 domain-containing protein [Flavobacteriaceae bacterium F08102]
MKYIQKYLRTAAVITGLVLLSSCEDDTLDVKIPYPNDITFNELTLGRFTYDVPSAPFTSGDSKSGIITVNVTGSGSTNYSGFALSNKNWRSYPWNLSPDFEPAGGITAAEKQQSIDSTAFSVYTGRPNRTENYLVGRADGNDAFFTLNTPAVVEHVLVANTTYNYLLATYGSVYSGTFDSATQSYRIDGAKVRNIQNPNTSASMYGRFTLPAPDGSFALRLSGHEEMEKRAAGEAAYDAAILAGDTPAEAQAAYDAAYDNLTTGYIKLTIEGSLNGTTTGTVDFYLAARPNTDPLNPNYNFVLNDWTKVNLTSLGTVDKVLFKISSSYTNGSGEMVYDPTFCLDGIRLAN